MLATRRVLGRDWASAWLFLLPALIVLVGLIAYPFFAAILLSFQNKLVGRPGVWVGLDNYANFLFGNTPTGQQFRSSVVVSFVYTFAAIAAKFVLGMLAALLLNEKFPGRMFFRALIFVPWAIPSIISAFTWQWMYAGSKYGLFNMILVKTGIAPEMVQWLANPKLALWSSVVAVVWAGMPFWAMMFLAGMQAIPAELYEAASIDGASVIQRFRHVTLPGLDNVIAITFMMSTIWTANSLTFVYVLTGGGPGNATMIFPMLTYQLGIATQQLGRGATVPLMFMPFFLIMIYFLTKRMLATQR